MRCQHLLIFVFFLYATGAFALDPGKLPEKTATFVTLEAAQVQSLLRDNPGKIALIDVRTPAEYQKGHIPDSKNIDFFGARFEVDISRLPKDEPVVLYCQSGRRSEAAAEMLAKEGFRKVITLKGGISGWSKASGKLAGE